MKPMHSGVLQQQLLSPLQLLVIIITTLAKQSTGLCTAYQQDSAGQGTSARDYAQHPTR